MAEGWVAEGGGGGGGVKTKKPTMSDISILAGSTGLFRLTIDGTNCVVLFIRLLTKQTVLDWQHRKRVGMNRHSPRSLVKMDTW